MQCFMCKVAACRWVEVAPGDWVELRQLEEAAAEEEARLALQQQQERAALEL